LADQSAWTQSAYEQLRRAAERQLQGERPGHTLSATALVHEAYLRLAGPREVPWAGRAHYYAAAIEAMRRVLLDHARSRGRLKRGGRGGDGGARPVLTVDLDAATVTAGFGSQAGEPGPSEDLMDFLALDSALCRLEERDPRAAEVVRLKFYAGLENGQTAMVLGLSERTVKNDWAFARAWLRREVDRIGRDAGDDGQSVSR